MWLGYDKPLPEPPSITPKKKHIKKRNSLIFLVLFFIILSMIPLINWCPNIFWGWGGILMRDYLGLYAFSLIIALELGVFSFFSSIFFKILFSKDPYYVKKFYDFDGGRVRVLTYIIWQEYWDEVYGEGDQG